MESVDKAPAVVSGYSMVLPSPWRRIPLRGGTKTAIRKILDDAFAGLPRDRVAPYRHEIEQRLALAVSKARQAGGSELYLPVGLKEDSLISASFVVSEFPVEFPEGADPALVAEELADAADGAKTVTLGGAPAIRTERTAEADETAGAEFASRRVDYLVSVPGNTARWLAITFSTLGAGDPGDDFAKLLVQLFDAIVSTFQWTGESPPGTGRGSS